MVVDFRLSEFVGDLEYVTNGVLIDRQGFQLFVEPLCKLVILLYVPIADSIGCTASSFL